MNLQVHPKKRSRLILESLNERHESQQWEEFIVAMLTKLELPADKREAVEHKYEALGHHVARELGIDDNDVHLVVQGSMKTQTTIAGDGREKFDLDLVVKLCGRKFEQLQHSEEFFQEFGRSLKGIEGAGNPEPKKRCWRLQYPGEPFYFDVTPAVPTSEEIMGTDLRVRDPARVWSPSNPEDFADWFCTIANERFPFQNLMLKAALEARTIVDPIPVETVHIDDILRRLVQLMKLHRDSYYKRHSDERRDAKPISVILVTLAAQAYEEIITNEPHLYSSAIEVALEVVDRMPSFIHRDAWGVRVDNPALTGKMGENFADRWNSDNGVRDGEFKTWHGQLVADLEALFAEQYSKRSEERVRAVFGEHGVKAWKDSLPQGLLSGLLATSPTGPLKGHPQAPRASGYKDSLA